MGDLELNCLKSWEIKLPGYKIKLWNEGSIDLNQYPFANEAYRLKKYAFVSDVVRLHALYHEGGIYLDTDVLILKSFDPLLSHEFFTGEYRKKELASAVIGAIPHYIMLKKLLTYYQTMPFDHIKPKTIPFVFDEVIWNNLSENVKIFPPDYFYPLPFEEKEMDYALFLTDNSFSVHLWNHSWKDEFALLKEGRIWNSILLGLHHIRYYPQTYRNKTYLSRYLSQFWLYCKIFFKIKIRKFWSVVSNFFLIY